jgi:hypothetical protein
MSSCQRLLANHSSQDKGEVFEQAGQQLSHMCKKQTKRTCVLDPDSLSSGSKIQTLHTSVLGLLSNFDTSRCVKLLVAGEKVSVENIPQQIFLIF